jgi:hypothetical protein
MFQLEQFFDGCDDDTLSNSFPPNVINWLIQRPATEYDLGKMTLPVTVPRSTVCSRMPGSSPFISQRFKFIVLAVNSLAGFVVLFWALAANFFSSKVVIHKNM